MTTSISSLSSLGIYSNSTKTTRFSGLKDWIKDHPAAKQVRDESGLSDILQNLTKIDITTLRKIQTVVQESKPDELVGALRAKMGPQGEALVKILLSGETAGLLHEIGDFGTRATNVATTLTDNFGPHVGGAVQGMLEKILGHTQAFVETKIPLLGTFAPMALDLLPAAADHAAGEVTGKVSEKRQKLLIIAEIANALNDKSRPLRDALKAAFLKESAPVAPSGQHLDLSALDEETRAAIAAVLAKMPAGQSSSSDETPTRFQEAPKPEGSSEAGKRRRTPKPPTA